MTYWLIIQNFEKEGASIFFKYDFMSNLSEHIVFLYTNIKFNINIISKENFLCSETNILYSIVWFVPKSEDLIKKHYSCTLIFFFIMQE